LGATPTGSPVAGLKDSIAVLLPIGTHLPLM